MAAVKGTPEERRRIRAQNRLQRSAEHVKVKIREARGGHQKVVVVCDAARAISKRITDEKRQELAWALARVAESFDVPENWKETP